MKKQLIISALILISTFSTKITTAQNIGINTTGATPDSSAMLDIASSNKGLLTPRMDSTSRKNIVNPAKGLMVFDSTYNSFYFYNGAAWTVIGGASSTPQDLSMANDSLFLSNDPTAVDLSAFKQDLQFANDTLTITNGQTPIDLKPLKDNMGDHIATQNVQLKGFWLGNDNSTNFPEGILVDTNGYVGVNTFPQNNFQVGLGTDGTQTAMIHQLTGNSLGDPGTNWQSFTATDYAYLTAFQIYQLTNSPGTPGWDYSLYEGEGTFGTLLASGNSSTAVFNFNDIPLVKDQKYTVLFTETANPRIYLALTNPYPGGTGNGVAHYDFRFSVHVKGFNTGLSVSSSGVSFQNYSFPTADGAANQVLTTNGSSALNWSTLPFSTYTLPSTDGSANQVLTTNGVGVLNWSTLSASLLQDADQNTKVQVEKNANENIIRFDINGQEKWTMQGNRLSNSQPNLFIGSNAGQSVTTGTQLTALGDASLANNTTGYTNTAIGYGSLTNNTTGFFNTSVGASSLQSVTEGYRNTAVGSQSLLNCTTCYSNTVMGHLTGSFITSGLGNTLIGYESGRTITTGSSNTMLGMYAGLNANNLSSSTLIGYFAGGSASNAHYLTAIGRDAGANSGTGGVYLGFQAGQNETGNDKLYIDNSNTATPLIWGDFATDSLVVNGALNIDGVFNINNAFSFPTVDGTNGQILQTDGTGQLTWVTTTGIVSQDLSLSGSTLSLTEDATPVDLSSFYQDLSFSGNTLSLTNDGTNVDLSGFEQDLSLSGNTLSLTNDGTTVDLSSFAGGDDDLGNHTTTLNLTIGSNAIQNNASTQGLTLGASNELDLECNIQRMAQLKSDFVTPTGTSAGAYLEMNNKAGTRVIVGADGAGLYSETDTFNMVLGNWTSSGTMSFHVNSGTKVMSLDASGRLGIGRIPTTNHLEVGGDASKTTAGNWLANSDARLKKNIQGLSSNDMLNKLLSLNGVTYEWNDNKTNTKRPEGIQYGFTAQNIQDVFPSLVTEDNNGFLQTPYGTYDAMTVEAIRALNDKIEKLENLSQNLVEENALLKSKNQQLETNITELAQLKNAFAELEALVKKNNSSVTEEIMESEK